jgi:hypothetical protein
MGVRGDFKDLVKIVRDGGLEVVTRIDGTGPGTIPRPATVGDKQEVQEERKTYKVYDTTGIRTTIQLDADYVTIMSPEVLAMPELCKRHTEILKEKLSVLERIRYLALSSLCVLSGGSILPVLYVWVMGGFSASGVQWLSIVSPLAGLLVIRYRNRLTWRLVRLCAKIMWSLNQPWFRARSWLDRVLTDLFPSRKKDSWIS